MARLVSCIPLLILLFIQLTSAVYVEPSPWAFTIVGPESLNNKTISFRPSAFGHSLIGDEIHELVMPHSADGRLGCRPLTSNVTDAGVPLKGKWLYLERGTCAFGIKVQYAEQVGAVGVIMRTCSYEPPASCDRALPSTSSFQEIESGMLVIGWDDGAELQALLQTYGNLTLYVPGTGALVPEEKAAFDQLVANIVSWDEGDAYSNVRNWVDHAADPSKDPCLDRISGVWCEHGHITMMEMGERGAVGTLAPGVLGAFTKLRYLNMAWNSLEGSLGCEIGSLTELVVLHASDNILESVSPCLGNLTQLEIFNVENNAIEGELPASIGALPNLAAIYLGNNQFSSVLPHFASPYLAILSASRNKFYGSLPSYAGSAVLETIIVSHNQLTGSLPNDVFDNCPVLDTVDLSFNSFHGSLPEFVDTTALTYLDFSYNYGFSGNVPLNWENLEALKSLYLQHNRLISPIDHLGILPLMSTFDISYNQLTTVTSEPTQAGDLGAFIFSAVGPSIQSANYAYNNLTGPWTSGWTSLTPTFYYLYIAGNQMTELCEELFSMPLRFLDVSNNALTGSIPSGSPTASFEVFLAHGNPDFYGPSLPVWATTDPTSSFKDANQPFVCEKLTGAGKPTMQFTLDASYYDYRYCKCDRGTFGTAPECNILPPTVSVAHGTPGVEGPLAVLSDGLFGNERLVDGVDTVWVLNGPDLAAVANLTATVRTITLSIVIDRTLFATKTDLLEVYEGSDVSGLRVFQLYGVDQPEATHFTVQVLTSQAALHFGTRHAAGQHFTASYSLGTACPPFYLYKTTGAVSKCVQESVVRVSDESDTFGPMDFVKGGNTLGTAIDTIWLIDALTMFGHNSTTSPFKTILLTIMLDRAYFNAFTDVIEVFQGDQNLKGQRLLTVRGSDSLATVNLTLTVLAPMVSLHFQTSTAATGRHFSAHYQLGLECPQYFSFVSTPTPSCVQDRVSKVPAPSAPGAQALFSPTDFLQQGSVQSMTSLDTYWQLPGALTSAQAAAARSLLVTFRFNATEFSDATDLLEVFEGQASAGGMRLLQLRGTDIVPEELTLTILTNAAAVRYQTSHISAAFTAEFSVSYTCPEGTLWWPETQHCVKEYDDYTSSQSAIYALMAVACIHILIASLLMGSKWHSKLLRAASRVFIFEILAFVLLLAIGAVFYTVIPREEDAGGSWPCHLRAWFTCIPLAACLSILFAKTNRVAAIFNSAKLTVMKVRDREIHRLVAILLSIQLVLLLIYSALPISTAKIELSLIHGTSQLVRGCSTDSSTFSIWLGLELAYFGIFGLWGLVLAFRTRNVPNLFNESQHILFALLFLLLAGVIIVSTAFMVASDPKTSMLIQGVGQGFVALILCVVLYGPKCYYLMIGWGDDTEIERVENTRLAKSYTVQEHTMSKVDAGNGHKGSLRPAGGFLSSPDRTTSHNGGGSAGPSVQNTPTINPRRMTGNGFPKAQSDDTLELVKQNPRRQTGERLAFVGFDALPSGTSNTSEETRAWQQAQGQVEGCPKPVGGSSGSTSPHLQADLPGAVAIHMPSNDDDVQPYASGPTPEQE